VGEALVSFLDEKGQPGIVERAFIRPPHSQIGPIPDAVRRQIVAGSVLYGHYERAIDRESAFEMLRARAEAIVPPTPAPVPSAPPAPGPSYPPAAPSPERRPAGRSRDSFLEAMAKSAVRSMGSQIGRSVIRGVLGGILGGRR